MLLDEFECNKDWRRQHPFCVLSKLQLRCRGLMEKYKDLYDALYDESVSTKMVEAFFQYQDGQSTTVEAEMKFYTMEGVA